MDNSILYGLRNPAMTDDIGMSMIERQFPTTISSTNYIPADGTVPKFNNGQLNADTYQSKKEKEYGIIKKVLIGLGVAALGIFGFKKGAKYVKQGLSYIKNNAGSWWNTCKNSVINIFSKIKTKISP